METHVDIDPRPLDPGSPQSHRQFFKTSKDPRQFFYATREEFLVFKYNLRTKRGDHFPPTSRISSVSDPYSGSNDIARPV